MTAPLPNPSIVFVPLDILTADELNQICQNVSYLAGLFPLTSSQIGAGAITSDKIATNAVKYNNINLSTFNDTTTPKIVGYFNGQPLYRRIVSGTTSSTDTTQFTIPNVTRIITFNVFCKSQYEQWWSVPNIHSEDPYHIYLFVEYNNTLAKVNLDCGAYMRSQPYTGYIEYI